MDAIETIERDGCVGEIHVMQYADPPDWDGMGHAFRIDYYGWSYRAELVNTDGCFTSDVSDVESALGRALELWGLDWDKIERYLWLVLGARIDYTHWDDRGSSLIVVATAKLREAWGNPDGKPDLEPFEAYRDGEVYGYSVETEAGEHIDSCWGYYGDRELPYIRQCIEGAIDDHRAVLHEERTAMFRRLVGGAA